jgi:hypothetical protein
MITEKEEYLGDVLPKQETLWEVQWFSRRELLPKGQHFLYTLETPHNGKSQAVQIVPGTFLICE